MRLAILTALTLMLAGCGATATPATYFAKNNIPAPTLNSFPHCRGYGCHTIEMVSLNAREWAKIGKHFPGKPKNAPAERAHIASAIGELETIIGPITGTHIDVAGTYVQPGPYQLDCIDESTNTTIYLTLLDQKGWIKLHDVKAPNTRVPFGVGVFVSHRTAVIQDKNTGEQFAVDSWFHDNGKPAEIVPIPIWKNRWHPGDPLE